MEDIEFMKLALGQARLAAKENEVPVGAVVVKEGKVIALAHNTREKDLDISGHAEIKALQEAAKKLGTWSLEGCSLYVTLEPCLMCGGAILQSRLSYLCFGAKDEKEGAVVSSYHVFDQIKDAPLVRFGLLENECQTVLKEFFASRRG